jgi:hypothetical protein
MPRSLLGVGALSVFAILLMAGVILLVLPNVIAVPFVFERNYNEGWNVYNTQRFFSGAVVYDDNLWRVNNYPPISFLVVGALDRAVGDLLLSGRLVALLSFAAVGGLAAIVTAWLGANRTGALFAGACALGFFYLAAPDWVAVDDPQTLAEAIMLAGFAVYLAGPAGRARLLATAGLVVLAGFTKHNLVAIPIAITLDLAVRSRDRLPFWLAGLRGSRRRLLGIDRARRRRQLSGPCPAAPRLRLGKRRAAFAAVPGDLCGSDRADALVFGAALHS